MAALIDGGYPLNDIAAGVSCGKADGELVLDLNKAEDNFGQSDLPIVYNSAGEIILLQMDGKMTRDEMTRGLEMTSEKSKEIIGLIRKAVENKYEGEVKSELRL